MHDGLGDNILIFYVIFQVTMCSIKIETIQFILLKLTFSNLNFKKIHIKFDLLHCHSVELHII